MGPSGNVVLGVICAGTRAGTGASNGHEEARAHPVANRYAVALIGSGSRTRGAGDVRQKLAGAAEADARRRGRVRFGHRGYRAVDVGAAGDLALPALARRAGPLLQL